MSKKTDRDEVRDGTGRTGPDEDAPALKGPRAVAFVWGPEVSPAPSLPFGRWKTAVPAAA